MDLATSFRRNPDGSWTCIKHATIDGPTGRIQVSPGSTFYPGTVFMNVDLAKWLEEALGGSRLSA